MGFVNRMDQYMVKYRIAIRRKKYRWTLFVFVAVFEKQQNVVSYQDEEDGSIYFF